LFPPNLPAPAATYPSADWLFHRRLRCASESATTQAAPIRTRVLAHSFQRNWLDGSARSVGQNTSGMKDAHAVTYDVDLNANAERGRN